MPVKLSKIPKHPFLTYQERRICKISLQLQNSLIADNCASTLMPGKMFKNRQNSGQVIIVQKSGAVDPNQQHKFCYDERSFLGQTVPVKLLPGCLPAGGGHDALVLRTAALGVVVMLHAKVVSHLMSHSRGHQGHQAIVVLAVTTTHLSE